MTTTVNINSALKINVTPIESGASGGVLFQKSDGKLGQSSNLHWDETNSRLSIGQGTAPVARLDVRAQGVLSTDIAFRVRNNSNTGDVFSVLGNGDIEVRTNRVSLAQSRRINFGGNNTDSAPDAGGYNEITIVGYNNTNNGLRTTIIGSANTNQSANTAATNVGYSNTTGANGISVGHNNTFNGIVLGSSNTGGSAGRGVVIGDNNTVSQPGGNPTQPIFVLGNGLSIPNSSTTNNCVFLSAGNNSTAPFNTFKNDNLLIGSLTPWTSGFDNSSRGVFYTKNGIAPTTLAADTFALYSADITAGNAAPHFRTENGNIIKLFRGAALTVSDGTLGNAVTRIAELEARLQAHGLIA